MTIHSLRYVPDPILSKKALRVDQVTDDIRHLLDDMLETMYENQGAGLAANQIGVLKRLVVIDTGDETPAPLKLINPELTEMSVTKHPSTEGCLSVPEYYAEVDRSTSITVQYLDEQGCSQELKAEGLLSDCIQHEIDHLNGIVFIDHLSPMKRRMALKKLRKLHKP